MNNGNTHLNVFTKLNATDASDDHPYLTERRARVVLRLWLALAVVLLFLLVATVLLTDTASAQGRGDAGARRAGDAKLGERIYREGILSSGEPLRATLQGDVTVEGEQASCASCHRRSGMGSSEGTAFVPPVTARALFGERELRREDLFRKLFQEVQPARYRARVRDPRVRPAYNDATLARALRRGHDPAGRILDPLMPRYQLGDEDTRHLIAYLKTLATNRAPGVTSTTIHFATVVAGSVGRDKRAAMLDVMEAYLRRKNDETRGLLSRPGSSPYHMDEFYDSLRIWELHVWELKGRPETWGAQLESFYRERPVFALLGGIGAGDWSAVHDFCERREVPCLFPNTELPPGKEDAAYSLYLYGGLNVEAEALARHLVETFDDASGSRVIQVFRRGTSGEAAARLFRDASRREGLSNLRERVIESGSELSNEFWERLVRDERPNALVLWLGRDDLKGLAEAHSLERSGAEIFLSAGTLDGETPAPALPANFRRRVRLVYPFALPQAESVHAFRVRAWLRSRGVERSHERIQANTHFALSITDHALMRLLQNYSRDYFIESVEHETENMPNPGVFPTLSLGPGQRFASRGSYIVKLPDSQTGRIEPVSGWIVP